MEHSPHIQPPNHHYRQARRSTYPGQPQAPHPQSHATIHPRTTNAARLPAEADQEALDAASRARRAEQIKAIKSVDVVSLEGSVSLRPQQGGALGGTMQQDELDARSVAHHDAIFSAGSTADAAIAALATTAGSEPTPRDAEDGKGGGTPASQPDRWQAPRESARPSAAEEPEVDERDKPLYQRLTKGMQCSAR